MKFFTHEVDSRNDDRIFELIDIHGLSGYGFYWAILEELYRSEDKGFQIEATNAYLKRLARSLNITDDRTPIRFLDTLADLGLIDKQLWNEHIIYSHGVMKRADSYMQRKAKEAKRKRDERSQARKNAEIVASINQDVRTDNQDVHADTQGTNAMSSRLQLADPYAYSYTDPDLNKEKEREEKTDFSLSQDCDEKPKTEISAPAEKPKPKPNPKPKISDPMGDRLKSGKKRHYWQKELSDRSGSQWVELLTDWASSSDCKQGFKNSLIEVQILHLKKRDLPHERQDAIGSLCNYIKNSDLASFDLRADEAIAFEKTKPSSAISRDQDRDREKVYVLPHPSTWTDEQKSWGVDMDKWAEFLNNQEAQNEAATNAH